MSTDHDALVDVWLMGLDRVDCEVFNTFLRHPQNSRTRCLEYHERFTQVTDYWLDGVLTARSVSRLSERGDELAMHYGIRNGGR